MVKFCLSIVFAYALSLSSFLSAGGDVYVTSNIDQYNAYEHQPLKGTITITHDQDEKVDATSFMMDKKPLQAEFIQDVKMSSSSPLVISYYYFQIPSQPAGLYVLPEVSVKVGGNQFRSVMSSYEVQAGQGAANPQAAPPSMPSAPSAQATPPSQPAPAQSSGAPAAARPSASPASLRLEASIEGSKPIYPGQRINFVYRYFYNTSVDLTKEQLPLLDAAGFLKIGDEEQKNYVQGDSTVSEVIQTVEAVKPGDFPFGPSIVEGYAYAQGAGGQHVYTSGKLSSTAPALTVTVAPFPEKDKPVSFNGAIGEYQFSASLASSGDVQVGDEITLSIDVTGKGVLEGVKLPEMCCQPGFSGFFVQSGLPPVGTIKGDTKTFTVRLRPINDAVKEIPAIEFSSFDPSAKKYIVLHSKPIPVSVKPAPGLPVQDLDQAPASAGQAAAENSGYQTRPIEIEGILPLSSSDLYNKPLGTWWAFAVIPFGIALLIYQASLRAYFERMREEAKRQTSSTLFRDVAEEEKGSPRYFELIGKSLKLRLTEAGLIPSPDIPDENLPSEGLPGEVRTFLLEVQESRFAPQEQLLPDAIDVQYKEIFEKIVPKLGNP